MPLEQFDKQKLLAQLLAELGERVSGITRRAKDIAASATHEESRSESDKDTRAIEESYLARGQAKRAAEAETALQTLRALRISSFDGQTPIALTALVLLKDDNGDTRTVFLAPAAGGTRLQCQQRTIDIVTPASPLGQELVGRTVDEDFEISAGGSTRDWTITGVI